jgi:hypothetical protein
MAQRVGRNLTMRLWITVAAPVGQAARYTVPDLDYRPPLITMRDLTLT